MPETQVVPSVVVMLQLMVYQLLYVSEKLVKDPRLNEIIKYCVPRKLLRGIYLWAWRGCEIHAKMFVHIDPDSASGAISIEATGRSGDAVQKVVETGALGSEECVTCPVWAQAIDLFASLCKDYELALSWSVGWAGKHDELNERFGFKKRSESSGSVQIVDKTAGMPEHHVANTLFDGLDIVTAFSGEVQGEVTKAED